jgi:glycosyltransferase involved in cell wall biosynthesis
MILAALACLVRPFQRYFLVVDRHTTFRLNKPHSGSLRTNIFMWLHRYTLKNADLTIVTNQYLSSIVEGLGGRALVLPDKLPDLYPKSPVKLKSAVNLLMISSFGQDEPLEEVIKACVELERTHDFTVYVTGNFKKAPPELIARAPSNLQFTGFLSEQAFVDMLYSVDGVLALTTSDYCMLCGCYEAVAANKPLVTSDKSVLREYFEGALFVDSDANSIASGIAALLADLPGAEGRTNAMHEKISGRWEAQFSQLEYMIQARQ